MFRVAIGESVTTPEELATAAVEIRRGYVAVKEAGRQEGLREELLTGARQTQPVGRLSAENGVGPEVKGGGRSPVANVSWLRQSLVLFVAIDA